MSSSLLAGASGLIAHQSLLDIVGNNIANINTTGYKAQRALFSDIFYETISPATRPSAEGRGGSNASQIGQGVKISQIDRDFSGGSLEHTGGEFDMAIDGEGFFVVSDGNSDFFTRAGTFYLDANGVLVAPGGLAVQRLPFIGEPNGANVGFQIPGDSRIRIPQNALIPAEPTSEIAIAGNLSTAVTFPSPTVKTTKEWLSGPSGAATELTLLNELASNTTPYEAGDAIRIEGSDVNGDPIDFDFLVSDTTTVGELIAAINGQAIGFQASLSPAGNIVLTTVEDGPKEFSIRLLDSTSNSGSTNFSSHAFQTTTKGKVEGFVYLSTGVVDPRGTRHEVNLAFERLDSDVWRMTASLADPLIGVIENNVVEPIVFNDDGSLKSTGENSMAMNLNGFNELQLVRLSFDNPVSVQQPTNQGDKNTAMASSNGHIPGTLKSTTINSDGTVLGVDSNGRQVVLAQLAIASFQNVKGLEGIRDGLYSSGLNSGEPQIGSADTNQRGAVVSGSLEASNVDIAFEFTRLIVAQRGFSANARTITVSDKVLEELTNIVR